MILNDIDFVVHYFGYNESKAFYESLKSIRQFYPKVEIIVHADNGENLSSIANYFNCNYIYHKENLGFPDKLTTTLMNKWFDRILQTANISNKEWILLWDNDNLLRGKIDKKWNSMIAGPKTTEIPDSLVEFIQKYNPKYQKSYFGGCGGTFLHRKTTIKCLTNTKKVINIDKENNYYLTQGDVILSVAFFINGYEYAPSLNHCETSFQPNWRELSEPIVHQYKEHYGKEFNWQLINRNILSDIDVHYITHNAPRACFEALKSFRQFYPNSTVTLHNDKGNPINEKIAKKFNCNYVYHEKSIAQGYVLEEIDNKRRNEYFQRLITSCKNGKTEWIMILEDDNLIRGMIEKKWNHQMNGPFGDGRPNSYIPSIVNYINQKSTLKLRSWPYGGCGGTILNREICIQVLEKTIKEIDFDSLINQGIGGDHPSPGNNFLRWTDASLTFAFNINGYEYGPSYNHVECWQENWKESEHPIVHQYKEYYGISFDERLLDA